MRSIAGAATPPTRPTTGTRRSPGHDDDRSDVEPLPHGAPARLAPRTPSLARRRSASGCGSRPLSFGGPAGQIAVMHRILVEEKRWISESRFLHALNYCMLLPGPGGAAARDLYRLADASHARRPHGRRPVRPARHRRHHGAELRLRRSTAMSGSSSALFFGLKAAVLAIVLEAVVRIGKRRSRTA